MNKENKKSGKRPADGEHSDAPGSSQFRIAGSQSDSNKPNNANMVLTLDVKVEGSPGVFVAKDVKCNWPVNFPRKLQVALLEKMNNSITTVAMEVLKYQVGTVFKSWKKGEDQEEISRLLLAQSQSDSIEPTNVSEVFTLNTEVKCSRADSVMSNEILEKVNSAVKKVAMKELSKQVETVYKPWNESFEDEKQKKVKIGNENYDAYKSNNSGDFFQTEKSHETRNYFYKQAVRQRGFDHKAYRDESKLVTLSKERGLNSPLRYLFFEVSNPGKDECRMIFEGMKNGSYLKEQMGKFLENERENVPDFEILVSCDPYDQSGTLIKWADVSPSDNVKCVECDSWGEEGSSCPCVGDVYYGEPQNYRNGIIMELQCSKVGKDNVIQVKYVKDAESEYFCDHSD